METLLQDLKYGLRMLAKNPGFTAVAVITLALHIGANTAVSTVVNGVLLRALPFEGSDRLIMVGERAPHGKRTTVVVSWNFLNWRARNRVFENFR